MTNPPPPPPPPPPPGGYPPQPPPPGGGYPPPPGGGYPPPPPPPGGGYPPPPQGYPPPQQQGYPPPQQGGYPPPQQGYPPQQGGYPPAQAGYPPTAPQGFDIGTGFTWAWNKFSKNAVALIVPALVYGLIAIAIMGIFYGLAFALAPDVVSDYDPYGYGTSFSYSASFGIASILVLLVGLIVLIIAGGFFSSAYLGGALDIANGQPVTIGSFFKPRNVVNVVMASLLVGVGVAIGYALCFLPGLVVALFAMFTTILVIDRNLSPVDAIKASIEIVKANIGQAILAYLIAGLIASVGYLACGIGIFVSVPVAILFQVYAYRKLSGGDVAPLTP